MQATLASVVVVVVAAAVALVLLCQSPAVDAREHVVVAAVDVEPVTCNHITAYATTINNIETEQTICGADVNAGGDAERRVVDDVRPPAAGAYTRPRALY